MQSQIDARAQIDLRFRPSLIVFVDEAGERICQQLKHIIQMAHLDEVLHQCIALMQVTTGEENAVPVPVGEQFPDFDNNMSIEPGYLDDLIEDALISIRLDSRVSEVMDAGYPVPIPLPQIYIVGDAHSEELKLVHESMQRLLQRRGLAALVCYVLDAYQGINIGARHLLNDPLGPQDISYWLQNEVPNFCFFYEGEYFHKRRHTVTQQQSNYAAAEMLFALIATGITPEPSFENFMKLPTNLTKYTNVGSIGTTMIIFPREEILEFCNARLGFALLQQWQADIDSGLLPADRQKQIQKRAYGDVERLELWIKDVGSRPGANGDPQEARARESRHGDQNERRENTCPTLDILRDRTDLVPPRVVVQHQGLYRDVRDRTRALFKLFHLGDIGAEARKQRKRRDTWTRVVFQRAGRAIGVYDEWNQVATQAWEAAGIRACAEVKREVDVLWSSHQNGTYGFEMARTYAEAYHERFTKLQDHLVRLRDLHLRDYQDSLDTFDALSQGEWLPPQNIVNDPQRAAGIQQAAPTVFGHTNANAQAENAGGSSLDEGGAGEAPTAMPGHLDAREEQIATRLETRVLWLQDQVPSIPTQITISLPFVLAVILTGLAVYPRGNLFFMLGLVLGVIAAVCIMNWAYWKKYQQQVEQARKDLLRYYRRVYAFHCERREDRLRLLVTTPLRDRVLAMRERLDNISAFIGAMQYQLDLQSQRVRRDLFNSPSGVRNVYVANGERLQSSRANTIEDFEARVTHQRETNPVRGCEWHQTLREMKEQLIELFRALEHSIIEMNEDEAREHIFAFTNDITNAYLRGPLVDIGRALDRREIWLEALERAQSPLYRAEVGTREPQMLFVCGQRADLNGGQRFWPRRTTPVLISDCHDWVLIAALFSGGLPPVFDPDRLFPPKHHLSGGKIDRANDDDDFMMPASPPLPDNSNNGAFMMPTPLSSDDPGEPLPSPLPANDLDETFMPPPVQFLNQVQGSNPVASWTTIQRKYRSGSGINHNIPPVQGLPVLIKNFERYERHLAYYGMAMAPAEHIDDPDLDQPFRYRLAQIGTDTNALETFVNKNKADYQRFASRLVDEPDNGLHAFYTSKSGFAVRYGQRALGLPANQVLPWPERLERLFASVHNPELQQLVEEDRRLTSAKVANPITPVPSDYPELGEVVGNQPALPPVRPSLSLSTRSQNSDDPTLTERSDSKKMRVHRHRLTPLPDQTDIIEPYSDL